MSPNQVCLLAVTIVSRFKNASVRNNWRQNSMKARKLKATADRDTNRSTDDTSKTSEPSGSKRKWIVLILCLITLCAGIYFAPRDYRRTPQKYKDKSPSDEDEETHKQVSTCESLMEAANYFSNREATAGNVW